MQLLLTNGYPYPCPDNFDSEKEEYDARNYEVQLTGVTHFEWLHTVTVEFSTIEVARRKTEDKVAGSRKDAGESKFGVLQ